MILAGKDVKGSGSLCIVLDVGSKEVEHVQKLSDFLNEGGSEGSAAGP